MRVGVSRVEMAVGVVLLAVVAVGIHGMAAGARVASAMPALEPAMQLVEERIDRIRSDPDSRRMPAHYAVTETAITGFPGYTRVTRVAPAADPTHDAEVDWLRVTVTVTGPDRSARVTRTVTIGGP